jgi:hypothetical protein
VKFQAGLDIIFSFNLLKCGIVYVKVKVKVSLEQSMKAFWIFIPSTPHGEKKPKTGSLFGNKERYRVNT